MIAKPSAPQLQLHSISLQTDRQRTALFAVLPGFVVPPASRQSEATGPLQLHAQLVDEVLDVEVRVLGGACHEEMSAGDWAVLTAIAQGQEVVARQDHEQRAPFDSELLAKASTPSGPRRIHSRLIREGITIVQLEASYPEEADGIVQELVQGIVASLRWSQPAQCRLAEQLEEAHFETLPIRFQYPSSWERGCLPETFRGQGFRLQKELLGESHWIALEAFELEGGARGASATTDPTALLQEGLNQLRLTGVHACGAAIVPAEPPAGFSRAFLCSPRVSGGEEPQSASVLVAQKGNTVLRMTLLGPTREAWVPWAITSRTVQLIRETLSLGTM